MLATLRNRRRNKLIADTAWKLTRAAALNPDPGQQTVTPQQVIVHIWNEHLEHVTADETRPHIAAAHTHWHGTTAA
ncbi:hypothetical protein [Streptomyces sp. MBT28]|uniref:hypothetical protein n=1 Tax=Streptomyces sp. MBT28 TaxID=1488357 RepID=UPI000619F9BE|nr:hypothetical protein [Streptomyces sp. MBT28]